jgi:DNA-binding response OmpR family regulator
MSTSKILVMDDEPGLRLFLRDTLTRLAHGVFTAARGVVVFALLPQQDFVLALVDLLVGVVGGMEVLSAIRAQAPDTVVIILTAHASLDTAVEGIRLGAHDYLFKPCKTVQLRQSIQSGLRKRQRNLKQRQTLQQLEQHLTHQLESIRATMGEPENIKPVPPLNLPPSAPETEEDRFLQRGSLIIDLTRHLITLAGHLLELSPTEFDLLAYLISEAPRVISPQELVREVQGYESEVWEARDTVRQHIYNIRQKIKENAGRLDVIRTVRGVGYTVNE